jgi:hypothetical protein
MKKTIKQLMVAAFVLAAAISANAQNISYKVTEDDPYAIKKLGVHIDPYWMDVWGANSLKFGAGARVDYHLGRLGSIHLDIRKAYLDLGELNTRENTEWVSKSGKFKKFFYIEPHIAFHLSDKVKSQYMNVVLSSNSYSYGGYTYSSSKYISVPGSLRKIIALHAGFYSLTSTYNAGAVSSFANNDSILSAVGTKNGKDTTLFLPGGTYGHITTGVLLAGFSFKKIKNLWINADGYGNAGHTGYTDFYIDLLFAPVIKLSNMLQNAGETNEWKIDSEEKKRLGWRLTWAKKKPMRSAVSYKFEIGQRPGLKGGSFFFNMIFGYNIAAM